MPRLTFKADGEAILNRWANKIEQQQQQVIKQLASLHKSVQEVKDKQASSTVTPSVPSSPTPTGDNGIVPKVIVPPITGLGLVSDVTTAVVGADGIAQARILASWTQSTDSTVVANGQLILSIENVTDGLGWTVVGSYPGNTTFIYIPGVTAGKVYNVQIIAQRATGEFSTAATAGPHTVSVLAVDAPVPNHPVISEQLLAKPLVLEFGFNFQGSTAEVPIDGYWVYKNTANDDSTALRWSYIQQSSDGTGQRIIQDTVGAGVVAYYWVTAIGPTGESTKEPAQTGAVAALPATNVMTVYRPSAVTNGTGGLNPTPFSGYGAAWDNNLNTYAENGAGTVTNGYTSECIWRAFPAASGSPTGIVLKVAYDCGFDTGGNAVLSHSVNGGGAWTTDRTVTVDAYNQVLAVTLNSATNLTQVQVKCSTIVNGTLFQIKEIWIEVTT